jgi:type IV pilus assembly protein PilW
MSGGAVMMHLLQRDLMQAGYGISSDNILNCNVAIPAGPGAGKVVPIAPVVIYPAGNTSTVVAPQTDVNERNTTDRLLVFYGSSSAQPEGNAVVSVTGNAYAVSGASLAFNVGDWVIPFVDCSATLTMTQVTATDVSTVTTAGAGLAGAKALYNLGTTPRIVAYAVRNGALTTCDYMAADCSSASAANWTALGGNIVALRAQYGRDTSGGAIVKVSTWDQTTPTSAKGWECSPAVRFVLVAKSTQYETKIDTTGQRTCEAVTAAAPAWGFGTAGPAVDLSKNGAVTDWQCYRYRTFENIAPLRNMVWQGAGSCT